MQTLPRCNDCLIICGDIKRATNLYKSLIAHFASFGIRFRKDIARRELSILDTDIRVVTPEEYCMKCKAGFRGRVMDEDKAWLLLEEDKVRLNNKKKRRTLRG